VLLGTSGCGGDKPGEQAGGSVSTPPESAAPDSGDGSGRIDGEIVETMTSGRYTYVQVRTRGGDVWVAGPATEVAVGETITVLATRPMSNFRSESLNRTFEEIFFVGYLREGGDGDPETADILMRAHGGKDVLRGEVPGEPETPEEHRRRATREVTGEIEPATNGFTIAQIYERREELAGRTIRVRGIVVKYTPGIMGVNWLHIQDGTGNALSFDLAVTTEETAEIGDIIVVEGVLASDKDFGAGYHFDAIVQGAKLTVE
jgi:hypothetical protein